MSNVPRLDKTNSAAFKSLLRVAREAGSAAEEVGLQRDLIELLMVRSSQINGCSSCLASHVPAALKAGVSEKKVNTVAAWHHSDLFSREEKAGLSLAEYLTQLPKDKSIEDVIDAIGDVFTEEQIAALSWLVIAINSFNRVYVGSGEPVF